MATTTISEELASSVTVGEEAAWEGYHGGGGYMSVHTWVRTHMDICMCTHGHMHMVMYTWNKSLSLGLLGWKNFTVDIVYLDFF